MSAVKLLKVEQRCLLHPREAADAGWLLEGKLRRRGGQKETRLEGCVCSSGLQGTFCRPEPVLR